MQNILSHLSFKKVGVTTAIVLAIGLTAAFGLTPRKVNVAKSENCANAPTVPTLNPFSYSYSSSAGYDCTDFAPLVIRNYTQSGSYPQSPQEHLAGVTAQAGDELYVRIYVHNGAQQNLGLTAYDVHAFVTVDGSAEPEHVIGATISGSNTNTVAGSMSIHTGPQDRLEAIEGSGEFFDYQANSIGNGSVGGEAFTVNFGNMEACFEFAKFFRFKVRVVGPAVQPEVSGSINATLGGQVPGQCLYYGNVNWQTQNAPEVLVTVSDPDLNSDNFYGNDKVFAMEERAQKQVEWIEPHRGYRFTLWQINPASGGQTITFQSGYTYTVKHLYESWVVGGGDLSCGVQPPSPTIDYTVTIDRSDYCVGEIPHYTITSNPFMAGKKILWTSYLNNQLTSEIDADYGFYLDSQGSWNAYGSSWQSSHVGSWKKEANIEGVKKSVTFTVRNDGRCGVIPPSPVINYDFTSNKSEYCVGDTPQYIITADKSLVGKKILWTSKYNGSLTSEIDADYGFYLTLRDNQAVWNEYGSTWNFSHIGTWEKIANIEGVRKSKVFTVKSCDLPPPPAQLVCTTLTPNVDVNQDARFSASGGTSSYSWSAPGGSPENGAGSQFTTRYSTGGGALASKTIEVSSGTQKAYCNVMVNQPQPNPLVCTVYNPNVNTNETVNVFATGGTGSYSWSAPGSGKTNGTGSNFNTSYVTAGSKNISLTSGSQTINCQTVVVTAPVNPLICQTLTPNVNISQTASFIASGGIGSYTWTALSGSPYSGSGSSFNTIYSTAGTKTVMVTSGTQSAQCPAVVVYQPPQPSDLSCELIGNSVVDINEFVSFRAIGGENTFAFNAPTGNPASRAPSTNRNFTTKYSQSGSKTVTVISGNQVAYCPIVTVRPPVSNLICTVHNSPVLVGSPAYLSASGGIGSYNWLALDGNPASGTGSNFSTTYSTVGSKTVNVTSGVQSTSCQVQVNPRSPVCEINENPSLTHDEIVQINNSSLYLTTIYYSFAGNNSIKITYVDPNDSQEKVLVNSTTGAGDIEFANIQANKTYLFKMYDISICGGLIDTLIVRKEVAPQCVSNTNFALNASTPVKEGETYKVELTWTSTGSHQIKIAQNSTSNVVITGNNTGSITIHNLAAGSTHSFYMIDAVCNTILVATTVVMPTAPVSPGGNFNYCVDNSCNTNINNTTNTTNTINTTNTTNTTNTYTYSYINNYGQTVPSNEYRQLSISKQVRNVQGGSFSDNVTVNNGDSVEYQITVRNTGSQPVNNVRISDYLPSGLTWVSGYFNYNQENSLGTLFVNDSRTLTFQARVNASYGSSLQNIARAYGDQVGQVQDDAWVFVSGGNVLGGNVSLTYSKRALNETKNGDATSVFASREDFITYTLTVTNNGNAPATNFVITDDLSSVLPYADMTDKGGGNLNGQVISFSGITIPAGGSVSKSFKVRVKYHLASNLSYVMTNTYGNTVTIRINQSQVLGAFTAPKTGSDSLALSFSGLFTLAFALIKKRKVIAKLIFT